MADDSLVAGLKDLVRKYIMLFPFVRKEAFVEIINNPASAMPKEIATSSIGKGFKDAIFPAYIGSAVGILVNLIIGLISALFGFFTGGNIIQGITTTLVAFAISIVVMAIATPIIIIVGMFLIAALYFIIAKILGGKGEFAKTMGMLGTIIGPIYLLSIVTDVLSSIPFVACIALIPALAICIYGFYLNFRMVKELHALSDIKAAVVVVIPVLLMVVVLIVAMVALVSMVGMAAIQGMSGLPVTG